MQERLSDIEGDRRIGPERAQDRDLLLAPRAAIAEVFVQAVVLDLVPADPDPQAEATAAQQIERRGLLGDERGLPLRQDHHAGHQLDPPGQRRQIAVEDEDLVERGLAVVRAAPVGARRARGTEHMIEDQDVVVACPFRRLRPIADHERVVADLRLRERRADAHTSFPLTICLPRAAA